MRTVSVAQVIPGTVHEAESAWYDTSRWPTWVDGLARVTAVSGEWPGPGAVVSWESSPAGRGSVTERVLSYQPLAGQTVQVEDQTLRGRQTIAFMPEGEQVEVRLSLEYEVRRRSIFTPLVDLVFIRGAIERSLAATLARFGAELSATRQPDVG